MQIEPDAKIVQTDFSSQPSLKSGEIVRALTSQAKSIQEFVVDRFDNLSDAGQPAAQGLGPSYPFAPLMGWGDQIDVLLDVPASAWPFSSNTLVSHIGSMSRQACTGQTWRWPLASGKQGGSQVLIMGTGRAEAKTSHDAQRSDTQQQMKAFVPANPITPANIRLTCQPPQTTSFGIASDSGCAIQHLVEALLGLQEVDQVQAKRGDLIAVRSHEPIELTAIRQARERCSQTLLRITVKSPFTWKLHPLSKQCQGDHLTSIQRSYRSGFLLPLSKSRLAKIIHYDVQCRQERIQLYHQRAPFLMNWFDKLTVRPGYLSFQVLSISHQTFNYPCSQTTHAEKETD
jgi:hypothetical protein